VSLSQLTQEWPKGARYVLERRFFVRDPFGKLVNILAHNRGRLPLTTATTRAHTTGSIVVRPSPQ
jgi:hypothetical protein